MPAIASIPSRPTVHQFSFFPGFKPSTQEQLERAADFHMKYTKAETWEGYSHHFHGLVKEGNIRDGGYIFNLKPFLKCYLYRQEGQILIGWAPSKDALRRVCDLPKNASVVDCPKGF